MSIAFEIASKTPNRAENRRLRQCLLRGRVRRWEWLRIRHLLRKAMYGDIAARGSGGTVQIGKNGPVLKITKWSIKASE